jgi:hypothetical protein
MTLTESHLEQALAVKRGLKRLRDIPAEQRPFVERTMHLVRDAEWGEVAEERELRTRQPRSARFIHKHPLTRS